MTLEEALVAYLGADSAITALIPDPNGGIKLFPEMAPQQTLYPYLTYQVLSSEENVSLKSNNDYPTVRLQIDCWAEETGGYSTAKALARAVKNSQGGNVNGPRLKEFTGTMASGPGVFVGCCRLEDQRSTPETPQSGTEFPVRRVSLDFMVSFVEQ